jgi:hypothetical protein
VIATSGCYGTFFLAEARTVAALDSHPDADAICQYFERPSLQLIGQPRVDWNDPQVQAILSRMNQP